MNTHLFVYGTLRDPAIQKALFGQTVTGTPAMLHGYRKAKLIDPEEAGTEYPMIFPWEDAQVKGTIYQLPEEFLEQTDDYEGPYYQRSWLTLENGKQAWVYHNHPDATIRFLPVGDSYTKGESVAKDETWPSLLIRHLQDEGIPCELSANPAETGLTTAEIRHKETSCLHDYQPDVVTLQGGVNDWVQGVPAEDFMQNMHAVIQEIKQSFNRKGHKPAVMLLNIPDFSYSPEGPKYAHGRNITEGIQSFNKIIEALARKHELPVVDIFSLSESLTRDDFFADDGLHPSGKAYQYWEEKIFEAAWPVFKKTHGTKSG